MAQPLRSLPPQIKNVPLVVPTRRVKFVRVGVIKASLLIRTTTVHYLIGVAWSNVRSLWVIADVPPGVGFFPSSAGSFWIVAHLQHEVSIFLRSHFRQRLGRIKHPRDVRHDKQHRV